MTTNFLALHNDIKLAIIYAARHDIGPTPGIINRATLHSFLLLCKEVSRLFQDNFTEIRAHYTLMIPGQFYARYDFCGQIHRDNGPAIVYNNGRKQEWYRYGRRHRDASYVPGEGLVDQPAIIHQNKLIYYRNGWLHRDDDGPAIIQGTTMFWYKNGWRHRDGDLPAVVYPDTQEWWQNNQFHRLTGPAIVGANGFTVWYHYGKRLT